jgi:hypothetical protein
MSDDTATDPYAAVLADLRAKRNKIDEAIALIESLRGDRVLGPAVAVDSIGQVATPGSPNDEAGQFLGMTVVDATKKLLGLRRKTMGTAEIASALQRGGLVLQSADPANTVGSIITRRFYQAGDIVRVSRGTWGLREWYPHTSFKRKEEVAREAAAATPTVGDQPPLTHDASVGA